MANKYIKEVEGGQATTLSDTDAFELDTGTESKYIEASDLATEILKRTDDLTEDETPTLSETYLPAVDGDGNPVKVRADNIGGATTGLPAGYIYGLRLSNNATDATNDIDIATGKCRDDTDAEDIVLASALTKRLDASWAVGTGNGGLDTGSIADTTYHVWLIKRSDTGVVDALFSTSASSPTMPTNYDYKRRIGSIIRSSGAILGFVQDGDDFMLKTPVNNVNVTNPGTSAVTRTLTVPTGIRVKAIMGVLGAGTSAAANPQGIYISDLSLTDATPSALIFTFDVYTADTGISQIGGMCTAWTNTSGQVRSRLQVSAAGTTFVLTTHGWVDKR